MINYAEIINNEYFGNPMYKYLLVIAVTIGFLLIGRILNFILKNYVKRIIGKTRTKIDDILIHSMEKPFFLFFLVIGLFVGSFLLSIPETVTFIFFKLIKSLLIFAVSWFMINIIDLSINYYLEPLVEKTESELDDYLVPVLRKFVRVILIIIAVIMVLSDLGFDVAAILAGLGIGGLAFALAAKDLIANIFGGIAIIVDKSYKIRDKIKVKGVEGHVRQIGLRTTVLESADGTKLIIPNSQIANNVIENVSFKFNKTKTKK